MKVLAALFILSILFTFAAPAHAIWPENGLLLSSVASETVYYGTVSDGADGCIVVWADTRNGNYDLFVQRIDSNGNPLWGANGTAVCVQLGDQLQASIVADNAGGAFIAWEDERIGQLESDIYAQRVQSNGTMAWQANGVPVCTATSSQTAPRAYSEGAVVLVAWHDLRDFGTTGVDVYSQRLNGNGSPFWAANGVAVCVAFGNQLWINIVSDGASGAFLSWEDERGAASDVYANHVNFLGTPDWAVNGNQITVSSDADTDPALVSDGQGGAIIAWINATGSGRVRAQRFNVAGAPVWNGNYALLSDEPLLPGALFAVTDGSGGVIVAWGDFRSLTGDVYAQRVTSAGMQMWDVDGVAVSNPVNDQLPVGLAPDANGGAVVLLVDDRSDPGNTVDLLAQYISATGIAKWATDGIAVVTGPGRVDENFVGGVFTSDGGIMTGWNAYTGSNVAFAQRIEPRYGYWGKPEASIVAVDDNPGDQGGQVAVGWSASERDNLAQQEITHYSLWRATDTLPGSVAARGAAAAVKDAKRVTLEDIGPEFAGVAVREGTLNGVEYLWEFVTTQQAIYAPGYSDLVATRQDSIGGDPAQHYFQVVAHTADSQIFFPSAPDSGHSVDNLAPAAPLGLAAMRAGGPNVDLDWSPSGMAEADFKEYWVYRGTSSGFPTDPAHFLTSAPDTMSTDTSADTGGMWYYKVLAVDIHDNPSDESNEAFVSPVTGIGDRTPALTALTVQNYPNPFSGATEMRIGLPSTAQVTIAVYDVAGRRVASRDLGVREAGFQAVTFDGRDASGRALPSGVYFYRVTAGNETATRKIVIRR